MKIDYYIISADKRARKLLQGKTYTIGRDTSIEITIQDALASRKHAEVTFNGESCAITDLNSSNGTLLNNEKLIGSKTLADGDRIQIGGQVFSLYILPPNADIGAISQQAPEISSEATLAPGMNMAAMAASSATFSGEITNGLLELLQFFAMTRKTGRLDLTDSMGYSVWLMDGVAREANDGKFSGFDALINIVRNPGIHFAFFSDVMPPGLASITGSSDGILMELARVLDEGNR